MTTGTDIQKIKDDISRIANECGRSDDSINLVAVTKSFPVEYLILAFENGLTTIGESRVQEAEYKLHRFKYREDTELHFIGHLQSNKVQKAVVLFDVIQSVDSKRLAKRISDTAIQLNKRQPVYLQINAGKDDAKFGVCPAEALSVAKEINQYPGIKLGGVMTIAPKVDDKTILRRIFSEVRVLRDEILNSGIQSCKALSMGMSNDYQIAIREGATHLRIGRALFGERPLWKPSSQVI